MNNPDPRSPLEIIMDCINELVRPRTNREPYQKLVDGKHEPAIHTTEVPSLLVQLGDSLEPGGAGESGARGIPSSTPTFRVDAYDSLLAIEHGVHMWLRKLDLPTRPDLEGNLRQLVGQTRMLLSDTQRSLAAETKRWLVWAKVTTGWEAPARTLHNSCPLCGRMDSIRIRVGDNLANEGASAMCVECGEVWDQHSIGLLAEHIRYENREDEMGESA